MPRRQPTLVISEIYHVFNRGVEKRDVFLTLKDNKRFIEALEHCLIPSPKLSRKNKKKSLQKPEDQLVEIIAYCLMPNHFHLLIKQLKDSGISKYLSRITNSYTKYFNTKNSRVGPLFQGAFKSVRIENDEQLLHVNRYIHLNPVAANLVSNPNEYQWSSLNLYLGDSSGFVSTNQVLPYYKSKLDYEKFILDQVEYKNLEQLKHITID